MCYQKEGISQRRVSKDTICDQKIEVTLPESKEEETKKEIVHTASNINIADIISKKTENRESKIHSDETGYQCNEVKETDRVYQEKKDCDTAKTILANLLQIQEDIVNTNKGLSEKTVLIEKELSLKQQTLRELTKEIEGKKKLIDGYHEDSLAKNKEIP